MRLRSIIIALGTVGENLATAVLGCEGPFGVEDGGSVV
jgi:hypothetical protein